MTLLAAAGRTERVTTSVSLVAGPLLMSVGDLLHPEERMMPVDQIAIVVDHASRWYTAHLLLFVGMLLFIPGFLGLTALTAMLKPRLGYVARVLMMIGTAGFASIISGEMLASRLVLDGVGDAAPISLWTNLFMGPVAAAVGPALLAFFVGTLMSAIPLVRGSARLRWPVALIVIGVLFVLAEILTARVVFSRIGNVLVFCGSASVAWVIVRAGADGSGLISPPAIT
ncbi:MAG TPA: hypothetical protein VFU28_21715 [Vicinamibacterales bacterium]|nr:hypothetical protein [Vicinamibacterales bacterium]